MVCSRSFAVLAFALSLKTVLSEANVAGTTIQKLGPPPPPPPIPTSKTGCDSTCSTCVLKKTITAVPCDKTSARQADWTFNPPPATHNAQNTTTITSKANSECVTWNPVRGELQLWPCAIFPPNPCQSFALDGKTGELTSPGCGQDPGSVTPDKIGGCLDVRGKVGPAVQLTRCYHQPNDFFKFSGDGVWSVGLAGSKVFPELCLQATTAPCTAADCCASCRKPRTHAATFTNGEFLAGTCDLPKEALPPRKVNLFLATPTNSTTVSEVLIPTLKKHRASFTGIIYQALAICGADGGKENGCSPADSVGPPHLARGHPLGVVPELAATLRKELGEDLELFPIVSYGNPGNATLLDALLNSPAAVERFAKDAVAFLHKENLTGINFDLEPSNTPPVPAEKLGSFLSSFADALHAADPPLRVSYDQFTRKPDGAASADLDRWISMATYAATPVSFYSALVSGLADANDKFGAGLCPSCYPTDSADNVDGIFDVLGFKDKTRDYTKVRELDVWAAWGSGQFDGWEEYWPRLEEWLKMP
jgi:hypothetical protein